MTVAIEAPARHTIVTAFTLTRVIASFLEGKRLSLCEGTTFCSTPWFFDLAQDIVGDVRLILRAKTSRTVHLGSEEPGWTRLHHWLLRCESIWIERGYLEAK